MQATGNSLSARSRASSTPRSGRPGRPIDSAAHPRTIPSAHGERGSAILATLVMTLLAVAGLIFSSVTQGLARTSRAVRSLERERAMAIAESGIDTVQVLLNAEAWSSTSVLDWSSDKLDNDDDGLVDEEDETLVATAELWRSDNIDNDADGTVDEKDEQIARVTCAATIGRTTYQLTGWLVRSAFLLPVPSGATYLNDPFAQVTFNGNAFEINGNDWNPDGSSGPASSLYGISVNGEPSGLESQLGGQQLDNVLGVGGAPSIGEWNPTDPDFIPTVIDYYTPMATITFTDYKGTYTGNLGNWAAGQYEVIKSNGNLEVGGGSSGAGILLVDGNLKITGGWSFKGYVFVTGTLILAGSANQKKIHGAVFIGGDVLNKEDLTMSGAANIFYSSEVLEAMREEFAHYRRAGVVEG